MHLTDGAARDQLLGLCIQDRTDALAAHLENAAGQVINDYIMKESSTRYFNSGRLVGTFRVSYGFIGIFGQLQLTSLIREGAGPTVNPWSLGIVLSGL